MVNIQEQWESKANSILLGKQIVKIEYLPNSEANDYGWFKRPITIIFNDGTRLIAMCDDEGNDGGTLWIGKGDKEEILPVLEVSDE